MFRVRAAAWRVSCPVVACLQRRQGLAGREPPGALVLVLPPRSWAQGSQLRRPLFICEAFSLFHERGELLPEGLDPALAAF